MTSPTVLEEAPVVAQASTQRSFLLVFFCTLIGALAQILTKQGTAQLGTHVTVGQVLKQPDLFVSFCFGIITNGRLFMGYVLYGINTLLMALALRGRELSRLYPIIALTYVWVTLLSLWVLPGEHMNFFRAIGIAFIVGGVSVLGMKR